jgi:dihydroneopterin aldolase
MALFAMEQYGLMLCGMAGNLVPAQSERQMRAALGQGSVPVWMPHALVSVSADIVPDWSFTSDSLSLWLARRLEAEALLLVKSVALPRSGATPEKLAQAGMIDTAFPALARGYTGRIGWLRREEPESLRNALVHASLDGFTWLAMEGTETAPRAAARGA